MGIDKTSRREKIIYSARFGLVVSYGEEPAINSMVIFRRYYIYSKLII